MQLAGGDSIGLVSVPRIIDRKAPNKASGDATKQSIFPRVAAWIASLRSQ